MYQYDELAKEVAIKYKQLLLVEEIFRTMKSILDTRPIFHKGDELLNTAFMVLSAMMQKRCWQPSVIYLPLTMRKTMIEAMRNVIISIVHPMQCRL